MCIRDRFKTGRISIDKIAKGSEGLTGAYLREVVTTAYLITIENGDEAITAKVLDESLNQVKKMKEIALKEIGVTATPTSEMFS